MSMENLGEVAGKIVREHEAQFKRGTSSRKKLRLMILQALRDAYLQGQSDYAKSQTVDG